MTAYHIGETIGAIVGMALVGSGLAWILRKIFPKLDFRISLGIALVFTTVLAGFINSSGRAYGVTVALYGIAAVVAYFSVTLAYSRKVPYKPLAEREPLERRHHKEIKEIGPTPLKPVPLVLRPAGDIAWGRGFFRIWVLLAAMYIIAGAMVGWSSLANPYVPTKNVAINVETGSVALLDDYGDLHWAMEDAVHNGTAKKSVVQYGYDLYSPVALEPWLFHEYFQKAEAAVTRYVRDESEVRRTQAIPGVIGFVLIPPLVVLAFGWAVGWAILGFRRVA